MKQIMYPDYKDSVLNVANSIRKHFDLKVYHETSKELDEFLDNDYENVILFLYDGMGTNVYKRELKNSFFDEHLIKSISSVGPSTTTASTTSFQTGLAPSEHHWLGWNVYIKEEKEIITLYRNVRKGDDNPYPYNVGMKYIPYKTIVEEINEKKKYQAYDFFPFGNNPYEDIPDVMNKVYELTKQKGKKYIYVYYENPDTFLHIYGSNNKIVQEEIRMLDNETKKLCDKITNSLVIVTADHGHIDVTINYLEDYKDILDTLKCDISIEGRWVSFMVKRGRKKEFKILFNKYFGNDFLLFTHNEIIKKELFGKGKDSRLESEIGDYVAIATSDKYISSKRDDIIFKSAHAGITKDEMEIPLIIIPKK